MIVDSARGSVGPTNMDNRPFRLKDEANLNIIDSKWVMWMVDIFAQAKGRS